MFHYDWEKFTWPFECIDNFYHCQDVSRQKSHGFVLHVYVHHAGDFCYKKLTDNQV